HYIPLNPYCYIQTAPYSDYLPVYVQFGQASSAQPVFECRFAACRRQPLLNMTLMLNGAGDAA
ncbi:hypothetical protein ACSOQ1_004372, partial [Yersinia enterocolitica]